MTTTDRKLTGNRIALPNNAQKVCASCLVPRGNTRKGWEPITRDGSVIGWTCPACPTASEPIRRVVSSDGGVRFAARVAITSEGTRKQVQRSFRDLETARAWVTEIQQAAKDSRKGKRDFVDPSLLTVRQVCKPWLAARAAEVGTPGGIRSETANGYASALSSPLLMIGDRLAREVTADDVEAVLRAMVTIGGKRGRPLSHRSASYALLALRLAFDFGVRNRWLSENVARVAKVPGRVQVTGSGASKARLRWSPAQLKAFRAHVDQTYADSSNYAAEPWVVAGMRLTLCGLRRSEVLGLDWSNVDVATGAIRVVASRTKTGRSNTTELNGTKTDNSRRVVQADKVHPGTAAALRELWLAQGRPDAGLVIRDSIGQPVQPDAYSRKFKALCKAAGVEPLARIHNVRHTVATALQEAGVPHNRSAALLGHDVQTYLRFYVVTDNDAAAEGAEAAGRVFAV